MGHVTSIPYCSHITHLGPIWYHDLGSLWAQDGLYGISVGMIDVAWPRYSPHQIHLAHVVPTWCVRCKQNTGPIWAKWGPCAPYVNHMGCPDGTHISAQIRPHLTQMGAIYFAIWVRTFKEPFSEGSLKSHMIKVLRENHLGF